MADRTGRRFGKSGVVVRSLYSLSVGVTHLPEAALDEPVLGFILVLVLSAAVLVVGFV